MCASTAHTMSIATAHCVIGGNVRNSCHTLFASEISFSIVLHQKTRDERTTTVQATPPTESTTYGRSLAQFIQKCIGSRRSIFCWVPVAANISFGAEHSAQAFPF